MKIFASLLLPAAMFLQQNACDVSGGPESIRSQFQTQLTPYFRNAKVEVNPAKESIFAYTCNTDAGPKLIQQTQEFLATNTGLAKLRSLHKWGSAFGSQVYR